MSSAQQFRSDSAFQYRKSREIEYSFVMALNSRILQMSAILFQEIEFFEGRKIILKAFIYQCNVIGMRMLYASFTLSLASTSQAYSLNFVSDII